MAKNKRYSKNEFRYNHDTGHMNYVFEEENGKYHSVGLTHDTHTFGKKNMPLRKNPEKGKKEKSYIRNGIITSKKKRYSQTINKKFSFTKDDFVNVKAKVRNYKKNRRKKKRK